jgi:hypothetical protein
MIQFSCLMNLKQALDDAQLSDAWQLFLCDLK